MCESAKTPGEVKKIIENFRAPAAPRQSRAWEAEEAEQIRARTRRGQSSTTIQETRVVARRDPNAGATLVETVVGAAPGELDRLMGQ
jgi:hypothetical protein